MMSYPLGLLGPANFYFIANVALGSQSGLSRGGGERRMRSWSDLYLGLARLPLPGSTGFEHEPGYTSK